MAKRLGAVRQHRIVAGRRDQRPVRRRRLVDRGVEIVAERRAERGLIAARDADRVDRARPGAARVRAQKPGDGARLRLQPLRRAFGLGQGPAMARLDLARLGVALLRRQRLALGGWPAPRPVRRRRARALSRSLSSKPAALSAPRSRSIPAYSASSRVRRRASSAAASLSARRRAARSDAAACASASALSAPARRR